MRCPACGVEQPEEAKFCKSCGGPVAEVQAEVQAPPAGAPQPAAAPAPAYPPAAYTAPRPARGKAPVILAVVALVAVVAIVGAVLLFALGGNDGVAGKYYNSSSGEMLELKSDGTFNLGDYGLLEGTYEVNGSRVTFTMSAFGFESDFKGTIQGNRITIEGEVYEKR